METPDLTNDSVSLNGMMHVIEPTEADILCGRPSSNKHPGNLFFRELVLSKVSDHMAARTKKEKREVTIGILSCLENIEARFLRWDKRSCVWTIVQATESRQKVSHALRDRALERKNGKEVAFNFDILRSPPAAVKAEGSPVILEMMTATKNKDQRKKVAPKKKKVPTKLSLQPRTMVNDVPDRQIITPYQQSNIICHHCHAKYNNHWGDDLSLSTSNSSSSSSSTRSSVNDGSDDDNDDHENHYRHGSISPIPLPLEQSNAWLLPGDQAHSPETFQNSIQNDYFNQMILNDVQPFGDDAYSTTNTKNDDDETDLILSLLSESCSALILDDIESYFE